MRAAYRGRASGINATVAKIMAHRDGYKRPQIDAVVRADDAIEVGRLLIDATALRRADQEAREAVRTYIGRP